MSVSNYETMGAVTPIPDAEPRMLTSQELADCCGGCRTNSAIETWMRRAIDKFCEVNGLPEPTHASGVVTGGGNDGR